VSFAVAASDDAPPDVTATAPVDAIRLIIAGWFKCIDNQWVE
jgi:hypothetical protein